MNGCVSEKLLKSDSKINYDFDEGSCLITVLNLLGWCDLLLLQGADYPRTDAIDPEAHGGDESSEDEISHKLNLKPKKVVEKISSQTSVKSNSVQKLREIQRKQIQLELNLPQCRTSKLDMCFAVVVARLLMIIKKFPQTLTNETFNRILAMQVHQYWQFDLLVLSLIHMDFCGVVASNNVSRRILPNANEILSPTILDGGRMKGFSSQQTTTSRKLTVNATKSITSTKSTKSLLTAWDLHQGVQTVYKELSRNGGLMNCCWGLFSSNKNIRIATMKTLEKLTMTTTAKSESGFTQDISPTSSSSGVNDDIWAALFEQGVYLLLEMVAVGIPVSRWQEENESRKSGLSNDNVDDDDDDDDDEGEDGDAYRRFDDVAEVMKSSILTTLPRAISCNWKNWVTYYGKERISSRRDMSKERDDTIRSGSSLPLTTTTQESEVLVDQLVDVEIDQEEKSRSENSPQLNNNVAQRSTACGDSTSLSPVEGSSSSSLRFPESDIREKTHRLLNDLSERLRISLDQQLSKVSNLSNQSNVDTSTNKESGDSKGKSKGRANLDEKLSSQQARRNTTRNSKTSESAPSSSLKSETGNNNNKESTGKPTYLGTRIISALLYSGNTTLKTNIFAGLLLSVGRNPALGKVLWSTPLTGSIPNPPKRDDLQHTVLSNGTNVGVNVSVAGDGAIIRYLLENVASDVGQLRSVILEPLIHLFETALKLNEQRQRNYPQTGLLRANQYFVPCSSVLSATVVVQSQDGMIVKMSCPLLPVVAKNSVKLATILNVELAKQMEWTICGLAASDNTNNASAVGASVPPAAVAATTVDKSSLAKIIQAKKPSELLQLPGSYAVWQEMFSHMLGIFMMKSIANMSLTDVIEAYCLAKLYDLVELADAYFKEILDRRNERSIIEIFSCALGEKSIPSHSGQLKPNLKLTIACLSFLNGMMSEKFRRRPEFGPLMKSILIQLHSLLRIVFTG